MATRKTNSTFIKVFLADSRALLILGLTSVIDGIPDITIVGQASSYVAAGNEIVPSEPDVVIVGPLTDCPEPKEGTRKIAMSCSVRPPSFLTLVDVRDPLPVDLLGNGVSGLLRTDASPDELAAAIRILSAGYSLVTPTAMEAGGADEQRARRWAATVSGREYDVLRLLARGHTNIEISRKLSLGESTIKTHIQNLLQKLNLRSRLELVIYAYETGLTKVGENLTELRRRDRRGPR